MIEVKQVLPDGSAVVDTKNLFRVRIQPSGEIAEELLERYEADAFIETFNSCSKHFRAEAVSYRSLAENQQAANL